MFRKFLGDKALYRRFFVVALPIIIQNAITNFVSLLDNIMVGQVGSIQMSGVSIVNGPFLVPAPARVFSPPSSMAPMTRRVSATPSASK